MDIKRRNRHVWADELLFAEDMTKKYDKNNERLVV